MPPPKPPRPTALPLQGRQGDASRPGNSGLSLRPLVAGRTQGVEALECGLVEGSVLPFLGLPRPSEPWGTGPPLPGSLRELQVVNIPFPGSSSRSFPHCTWAFSTERSTSYPEMVLTALIGC